MNSRRETVPAPRTGGRESTIAEVRPHPPQAIVGVAQTRRNKSRCRNRAATLEQLREVIERRVDRACTRCAMGLAASGEHQDLKLDALCIGISAGPGYLPTQESTNASKRVDAAVVLHKWCIVHI